MRALVLVFLLLAGPALAQDREATLADIRQELAFLSYELQRLNRGLSTTGGVGSVPQQGGLQERQLAGRQMYQPKNT